MKIKVVVVDDEPLAREGIANYIKEFDFLTLVACCENPIQLMKVLDEQTVDLIFLDIQMPKMHGIDFLKSTTHRPMIILITAFPNYALEGFQLDVMDYLLKPVTFDRFFKSVNKAKDYFQLVIRSGQTTIPREANSTDYFFIKCGSKYEKIQFAEILYIEGLENYVTIYTEKEKYVTLLNLKTLEKNLDSHAFLRVHKSYIVSIVKIESIEGNEMFIESHRVPISRTYKEQVNLHVFTNKLWGKGM
jgi:two-component system LytT family response regulator